MQQQTSDDLLKSVQELGFKTMPDTRDSACEQSVNVNELKMTQTNRLILSFGELSTSL